MIFNSFHRLLENRAGNHLIYWVLFVLITSFIISLQQNYPFQLCLFILLVRLTVILPYTYLVTYWLIPGFLLRGRTLIAAVLLAGITVLAWLLNLAAGRSIRLFHFIRDIPLTEKWLSSGSLAISLLWIIGPALLFVLFKYAGRIIKKRDISRETETRRMATELQVLKGQLNPHFLFNTLNNIYSLALAKSDKTAVVIAKMADMFHYILYECNAVEVPVSKELKLIDNYIELEQLRYSDRLSVQFNKDIDNPNYTVPPMLLYAFVENCFRHGSSPDPDMPWIKISVRVRNSHLAFEVRNSIPGNAREVNGEGVGLLNSKRRLELIYPKNHSLVIREENNEFYVKLDITKKGIQIP